MGVYGQQIVDVALTQKGDRYKLGVEVSLHDPDPEAFDCSEFVQWVCARVGLVAPDGTVAQFPWSIRCSVEHAIKTPGALLFVYYGPDRGGGRGNHVAISQGNGTTIEARSTRHGVGVWSSHNRGWTHGGLIPGVNYAPQLPTPTLTQDQWRKRMFQWTVVDGNSYLWDGEKVVAMNGLPTVSWQLAAKGIAPNIMDWGQALSLEEHNILIAALSGSDPNRSWSYIS